MSWTSYETELSKNHPAHKPKMMIVGLPGRFHPCPAFPGVAATSCLPPCSHVMTPPAIGSPVKTTSPAVAVTPATMGVGACQRHFIFPVFASIALSHPFHWLLGSKVPQPLV